MASYTAAAQAVLEAASGLAVRADRGEPAGRSDRAHQPGLLAPSAILAATRDPLRIGSSGGSGVWTVLLRGFGLDPPARFGVLVLCDGGCGVRPKQTASVPSGSRCLRQTRLERSEVPGEVPPVRGSLVGPRAGAGGLGEDVGAHRRGLLAHLLEPSLLLDELFEEHRDVQGIRPGRCPIPESGSGEVGGVRLARSST